MKIARKKRIEKGKLVIIITMALLLAAAILAYLNAGNLDLKRDLEMKAEFLLTEGNQHFRVTMGDILALDPVNFTAIMDTSTTDPTPVSFTGVELSKICAHYGLFISPRSVFQFKALDGYGSAVTGEEVLTSDNVYVCIAMNGEALKPKKEGGLGPYLMVIKGARFSQRWCKFIEEIVVR